jgi:hypothetical protein
MKSYRGRKDKILLILAVQPSLLLGKKSVLWWVVGPQRRSESRCRKECEKVLTGNRSQSVQPVASNCTVCSFISRRSCLLPNCWACMDKTSLTASINPTASVGQTVDPTQCFIRQCPPLPCATIPL